MLVKVRLEGTNPSRVPMVILAGDTTLGSQADEIAKKLGIPSLDGYEIWELQGGADGELLRPLPLGDSVTSLGLRSGVFLLVKKVGTSSSTSGSKSGSGVGPVSGTSSKDSGKRDSASFSTGPKSPSPKREVLVPESYEKFVDPQTGRAFYYLKASGLEDKSYEYTLSRSISFPHDL
jgi:hypothetical protein